MISRYTIRAVISNRILFSFFIYDHKIRARNIRRSLFTKVIFTNPDRFSDAYEVGVYWIPAPENRLSGHLKKILLRIQFSIFWFPHLPYWYRMRFGLQYPGSGRCPAPAGCNKKSIIGSGSGRIRKKRIRFSPIVKRSNNGNDGLLCSFRKSNQKCRASYLIPDIRW